MQAEALVRNLPGFAHFLPIAALFHSERSFRGLRAVADLPGLKRRIVVYLGERRQQTQDGIQILPLRQFLRLLEEGTLF